MATTTTTSSEGMTLEDAYAMIIAAEKQLVKDLDAALSDFQTKLEALGKGFPTNSGSAAIQGLNQIKQSVMSSSVYQMQQLKTTYGLNTPVTTTP